MKHPVQWWSRSRTVSRASPTTVTPDRERRKGGSRQMSERTTRDSTSQYLISIIGARRRCLLISVARSLCRIWRWRLAIHRVSQYGGYDATFALCLYITCSTPSLCCLSEREREREKERGSRGEERASAAVASLHRAQLRLRNITAPVRPSAMASYIRTYTTLTFRITKATPPFSPLGLDL